MRSRQHRAQEPPWQGPKTHTTSTERRAEKGQLEAKHWTIDIHIDEHEERTRAKARLHNRDETGLMGVGIAQLNPSDTNVPEIGDELAVARALADLAHQLLEATVADIEAITHQPAHLTR